MKSQHTQHSFLLFQWHMPLLLIVSLILPLTALQSWVSQETVMLVGVIAAGAALVVDLMNDAHGDRWLTSATPRMVFMVNGARVVVPVLLAIKVVVMLALGANWSMMMYQLGLLAFAIIGWISSAYVTVQALVRVIAMGGASHEPGHLEYELGHGGSEEAETEAEE